jgi:hypothetical protein
MSSQSKESSSTVSTADHSMAIIIGNSTEDQATVNQHPPGHWMHVITHLWMNLN